MFTDEKQGAFLYQRVDMSVNLDESSLQVRTDLVLSLPLNTTFKAGSYISLHCRQCHISNVKILNIYICIYIISIFIMFSDFGERPEFYFRT